MNDDMSQPKIAPPGWFGLIPVHGTHGFVISLSLAMGAALILGGPQRVSSPAYETIANLGGCYVWGSIYLLVGAVLWATVHNRLWLRWSLLIAAVAYAMLAAAFAIAAFRHSESQITAIVAYGWIASLHVIASEKTRTGRWRISSVHGHR